MYKPPIYLAGIERSGTSLMIRSAGLASRHSHDPAHKFMDLFLQPPWRS